METLTLRNLHSEYELINKLDKYETYYDGTRNNMIVFTPYDEDTDVTSICDGISNHAYEYLINELNTKHNLIVHWSQVEGTTSDYRIYYDIDPATLKHMTYSGVLHALENVAEGNLHMKYNAVVDGVKVPIKFHAMNN